MLFFDVWNRCSPASPAFNLQEIGRTKGTVKREGDSWTPWLTKATFLFVHCALGPTNDKVLEKKFEEAAPAR